MDSDKTTSSEFERRASMRSSWRVSVRGEGGDGVEGDMDDDEMNYEAMAMADGFRPQTQTQTQTTQDVAPHPRPSSSSPQNRRSTASAGEHPVVRDTLPSSNPSESADTSKTHTSQPLSRTSLGPRPSSIAKPPRSANDSISLQHTGGMSRIDEGFAASRRTTGRESIASSDSQPYTRMEGPYQGPSAPSHPYGVYTQNAALTRTLSVTTTSTGPMPESSFAGAQGPTHPYGMYTQGTVDELAVDELAVDPATIPVGFTGRAAQDQYQRRLGPDGVEIGDIVGVDGHTEQLPPYSREPPSGSSYGNEAAARKAREAAMSRHAAPAALAAGSVAGAAVIASAYATDSLHPPPTIAGAGGLGLATRNPEFEGPGTDEPGSPRSRHSSRSFVTEASQHQINTAAAEVVMSEKPKPLKRWQAWGKRKCCGVVPYWALVLAITVVVLVAGLVLGAVVGTQMRDSHKKVPHPPMGDSQSGIIPTTTATETVTYDATAIPTPTDLPPLVTGSFSLPLVAGRVTSTCFNDTTQSQAWSCNVALLTQVLVTVQGDTSSTYPGDYTVSITYNESLSIANNVYAWGSQPGLIEMPIRMGLVNDTSQPGRGPAWFTMVPFNKTIVISEQALTATSSPTASSEARLARAIYAHRASASDYKRKGVAQPGDKPWVCTWPRTFLEVFIYPMQNSSWAKPYGSSVSGSSPSSTLGSLVSTGTPTSEDAGDDDSYTTSSGYDSLLPTTASTAFSDSPSASPTNPYMPLGTGQFDTLPPLYPRVIKIEERRVSGSTTPSCRQVEIQDDGQPPKPVKDADGNDVVIWIVEEEPSSATNGAKNAVRGYNNPLHSRGESSEMSDCGCIWFTT